ncbi:MAG: enoyl-CoA hydratase/isomerase family protein [Dehalococcoidia bacterium]|nr:enoyl-CoA hydratase/isomerase family protein [Dehalococcoidia bacterium]HRC61680.1 enoyl-CoA hydratase-related protein [Dehalococcoidia bacterium]
MPDLLYEKKDFYAVFTMNRPERLNALGGTMNAERQAALDDFNSDPKMRVGIVTGAGRAFCAGADLKEMAERNASGVAQNRRIVGSASMGYAASPKPFIAAINGLAIGGGFETSMDCDIRICSTEAYFGLFEPKRGILAGYGMHHLPRIIGLTHAAYILLTADRVSPEQAKEWGIVSEVTEPDRLLPRAVEIAEMIVANAPLSIEGTKAMLQAWRMAKIDDSYRLGAWVSDRVLLSDDAKEGPKAFAEKRAPNWVDG